MHDNFTKYERMASESTQRLLSPKRATVDLLKQFARVYRYSTIMPIGLGAFMAN